MTRSHSLNVLVWWTEDPGRLTDKWARCYQSSNHWKPMFDGKLYKDKLSDAEKSDVFWKISAHVQHFTKTLEKKSFLTQHIQRHRSQTDVRVNWHLWSALTQRLEKTIILKNRSNVSAENKTSGLNSHIPLMIRRKTNYRYFNDFI